MVRIWDANKVANAMDILIKNGRQVDAVEWISNPINIVLENDNGDLALFEHGVQKVYSGHYCFKSRGRQAIKAAQDFLDELFNTCYNIHVVIGLVPLTNKPSRWISRQIGFTSYGNDELANEEYELFILTKKEFNHGR